MPKVKTNSSAKKRFKVTGTGKITFQKAFKRHILTKKSKKHMRKLLTGFLSHPKVINPSGAILSTGLQIRVAFIG